MIDQHVATPSSPTTQSEDQTDELKILDETTGLLLVEEKPSLNQLNPCQTKSSPENNLSIKIRLLEDGGAQIIEVDQYSISLFIILSQVSAEFFFTILYYFQAASCSENIPGRRRKCRERVKSYQEYFEGDVDVQREGKRRKKTRGSNQSGNQYLCNFCQKRYLTKQSLVVRRGGGIYVFELSMTKNVFRSMSIPTMQRHTNRYGFGTDDSYRNDCSQSEYLIDIRLTSQKIVFYTTPFNYRTFSF